MTITITIASHHLNQLDLSPATEAIESLLANGIAAAEQQVQFAIDLPRDPTDPRELSELPEVRLWFLRLDARYPWLPFVLDWKAGELGRYTAMLVPHQFHPTDGIQFNPEALELFVMGKLFVLADWMAAQGIGARSRLQGMAQMLGYDLDNGFFDLLGADR
jgi:hypothetical protein